MSIWNRLKFPGFHLTVVTAPSRESWKQREILNVQLELAGNPEAEMLGVFLPPISRPHTDITGIPPSRRTCGGFLYKTGDNICVSTLPLSHTPKTSRINMSSKKSTIKRPKIEWTDAQMSDFKNHRQWVENNLPGKCLAISNISNYVFSCESFSRLTTPGHLHQAIVSRGPDGTMTVEPANIPTSPDVAFYSLFWADRLASVTSPAWFGSVRKTDGLWNQPRDNAVMSNPMSVKSMGIAAENKIKEHLREQKLLLEFDYEKGFRSTVIKAIDYVYNGLCQLHNEGKACEGHEFEKHGFEKGYEFGYYRPDLVQIYVKGIPDKKRRLEIEAVWFPVEIKYSESEPKNVTLHKNWAHQLWFYGEELGSEMEPPISEKDFGSRLRLTRKGVHRRQGEVGVFLSHDHTSANYRFKSFEINPTMAQGIKAELFRNIPARLNLIKSADLAVYRENRKYQDKINPQSSESASSWKGKGRDHDYEDDEGGGGTGGIYGEHPPQGSVRHYDASQIIWAQRSLNKYNPRYRESHRVQVRKDVSIGA
ncbi:hypothetical protein T439DRAFT_357731 [Meredithblackwellia eburnea MCA 4105]